MSQPVPGLESPPQRSLAQLFSLKIGLLQIAANLGGAGICIFYFSFLDTPQLAPMVGNQVQVGIYMTLALVVVGFSLSLRSTRRLARRFAQLRQGLTLPPALEAQAQRQVLNAAPASALLSFFIWIFAALFMASYRALIPIPGEGVDQALWSAVRIFLGIFVSGVATASVIFFYLDGFFRRRLPVFFPRGGVCQVRRVFRLSVRWRLLYSFLLVGAAPLVVVGALFYSKLVTALGPAAHNQFAGLLYAVVFVPAAMLVAALVLSHLVSQSIADPVGELDQAMRRVAQGDLEAQAPVGGNDELGSLAESFNQMVEGLKERERIKETFGRFVSKEIANQLLANKPSLGGEIAVVTTLFSDIRNYTNICEQLSPQQVITMLNGYFKHMVKAVEQNGGLVYQFVGDGIMAVFGAPHKLADHATAAVDCAHDMLAALERFNQEQRAQLPPLDIGVGINTGSVVAGIIGSEQRMEYRVVGDAVNLASRIEALNKELGTTVLISRTTRDLLTKPYGLTPFEPIQVKGKSQVVQVYAVQTAEGPAIPE